MQNIQLQPSKRAEARVFNGTNAPNVSYQNLPLQQILPTLILLLPLDCFHDQGTAPDLYHASRLFLVFF